MGHLPGRGRTLHPHNGRCCPCLRTSLHGNRTAAPRRGPAEGRVEPQCAARARSPGLGSDRNRDPLAHDTPTDTDHPPPHTRHTHTTHILTHRPTHDSLLGHRPGEAVNRRRTWPSSRTGPGARGRRWRCDTTSSSTIAMVLCHGVCARADEPVPTEGSAVNEPAPAPGQPPSKESAANNSLAGGRGSSPDHQRQRPRAGPPRRCKHTVGARIGNGRAAGGRRRKKQ